MTNFELLKNRDYEVVKSNTLIKKSRYDLSLQEQKIILRLIQMIAPDDKELKEYTFTIKDFCEFCGFDDESGKNYSNVKSAIKSLADKSYWIKLDNGKETLMRWIEKPVFDPQNGIVSMKIDAMMKPYLLELHDYFTQYSLYYVVAMKSKYSIRLYELLKSYQNLKQKSFDINDLKTQLMAETYDRWVDFKRYVVEVAIKEINLISDISVTYALKKKGLSFVTIIFSINFKENVDDRVTAWGEVEKRLDKKKLKKPLSIAIDNVMPIEDADS